MNNLGIVQLESQNISSLANISTGLTVQLRFRSMNNLGIVQLESQNISSLANISTGLTVQLGSLCMRLPVVCTICSPENTVLQLKPEDMKLLDSLNENLRTVFLN